MLMKEDRIISLSDENEYLKIENIIKEGQQYLYKALIAQDHFSQKLKDVISEYWECISLFSISLADELEDKIKKYNLVLEKSKMKIFDIELKDGYITFFSKYPTKKGFLDDYPNSI